MSASRDHANQAQWRDILVGKYASVSAVLAGGVALYAVNITITATMLPSIVADIGGQHLYAWNATLAMLAAILSAALTGKLLRRTGIQISFLLACLTFAAGSLISALAPTMPIMLLGRVIQGAGGGMMVTLCYSMIVFVYPETLWPRAMALLSGTWGITMLCGPALGGIFAELEMWRAGFGSMVPVVGIFALLALRLLPRIPRDHTTSDPVAFGQLILLAGSILAVSIGSLAPSPILALAGLLLSIILVLILMHREQGSSVRLFPRGATRAGTPLFLAIAIVILLVFCVNIEFFMPFFLQKLHGMSPLKAGYISALISIGWAGSEVYCARFTGAAMHRSVQTGPILLFLACLALGIVTPMFGQAGPVTTSLMALALIILGTGIGAGWPHLNTFVLKFTEEDERDMAASALSTIQMFAVAFGTAVAGLIGNLTGFRESDNPEALANSAIWLFLTFAIAALLAILASLALIRKLKPENPVLQGVATQRERTLQNE